MEASATWPPGPRGGAALHAETSDHHACLEHTKTYRISAVRPSHVHAERRRLDGLEHFFNLPDFVLLVRSPVNRSSPTVVSNKPDPAT